MEQNECAFHTDKPEALTFKSFNGFFLFKKGHSDVFPVWAGLVLLKSIVRFNLQDKEA